MNQKRARFARTFTLPGCCCAPFGGTVAVPRRSMRCYGHVAQWESAAFTRQRSEVRYPPCPPSHVKSCIDFLTRSGRESEQRNKCETCRCNGHRRHQTCGEQLASYATQSLELQRQTDRNNNPSNQQPTHVRNEHTDRFTVVPTRIPRIDAPVPPWLAAPQ